MYLCRPIVNIPPYLYDLQILFLLVARALYAREPAGRWLVASAVYVVYDVSEGVKNLKYTRLFW